MFKAEADPSELEHLVDIGNALAVLAHAGVIAMLLVPPSSFEDRFAKPLLAKERDQQYGSGTGVHDPELMRRALQRSFSDSSPRFIIGARAPPRLRETAQRFTGAVLPQPVPAMVAAQTSIISNMGWGWKPGSTIRVISSYCSARRGTCSRRSKHGREPSPSLPSGTAPVAAH